MVVLHFSSPHVLVEIRSCQEVSENLFSRPEVIVTVWRHTMKLRQFEHMPTSAMARVTKGRRPDRPTLFS